MSVLAILVTTVDDEAQARASRCGARFVPRHLRADAQNPFLLRLAGRAALDDEVQLQMTTTPERCDALVRRLHSYETPEMLRVDASVDDPDWFARRRKTTAPDASRPTRLQRFLPISMPSTKIFVFMILPSG